MTTTTTIAGELELRDVAHRGVRLRGGEAAQRRAGGGERRGATPSATRAGHRGRLAPRLRGKISSRTSGR
jgi:hypothetical protein